MRLHCHFASPLFAYKCSIKRRYIAFADSSQSQLPPLRSPNPLPSPSPPKQSPPLHLLQKPSPLQFPPLRTDSTPPFLNLFNVLTQSTSIQRSSGEKVHDSGQVTVEYYDPKPGDFVVGIVLSGNENKLDVSIGSDMLGSMKAKEALPFCKEEVNWLACDLPEERENGLFNKGKVGIVRDEECFSEKGEKGRRAMEAGTVVFAEVLGRTLSGRPLLSCRRLFRRIAWHRVRQVLVLFTSFMLLFIWLAQCK